MYPIHEGGRVTIARTTSLTICRLAALGLVAASALLGGCGSLGYPIKDYAEVYSKSALALPDPDPQRLSQLDRARVEHGRYLVDIMGCAGCHTDGALVGAPNGARLLAGSEIGIAYTDPLQGSFPGVAFPSNLTPDPKTGLGEWSDAQILTAIRTGSTSREGGQGHLMVMAWPVYLHLSDADASAIVAYLRSIPPIEHRVPTRVSPGTRASAPYVYFGVYRSGPEVVLPRH